MNTTKSVQYYIRSISYYLVIASLLVACFPLYANAEEVDTTFYSNNDILYYNPADEGTVACTTSATNVDSISNVPEPWKSLISSTASKYPDVDPRLVAATLYIENRGWPDYEKNWATSSAGAKGPWQFIDSSWALMGEDGDGDGVKDANNPKDAVHGAFVHQKGSAGKPLINGFSGNLDEGLNLVFNRDRENLLSFMASYNGRGAPDGVALKDFPRGENADYVKMAYYVIGSNFTQTLDTSSGEVVSIGDSGPLSNGSAQSGDCGSNSAENGYVNTDGFSFPIGLPKSEVSYGYGKLPCNRDSCHHDNSYAFDLFGDVGTPVFAIEAGVIEGLKDGYDGQSGCFSIHLAGKSGWKYWYGHIKNPEVSQGESVQPGQPIAVVGESKCAKGTAPHLHIDRGTPKGRTGGEDCCRDKSINSLINSLYADMPE